MNQEIRRAVAIQHGSLISNLIYSKFTYILMFQSLVLNLHFFRLFTFFFLTKFDNMYILFLLVKTCMHRIV